jgi:hypothetical protein
MLSVVTLPTQVLPSVVAAPALPTKSAPMPSTVAVSPTVSFESIRIARKVSAAPANPIVKTYARPVPLA